MRRLARGLGWFLLLSFISSVVLRFFLLEVAAVGHEAMLPTVQQGDELAVLTMAKLERGDVVVCEHPNEPGRMVVGRLLGLPGDHIEIARGGRLSINSLPVGTTPGEPPTVAYRGTGRSQKTLDVVRETLGNGRTYLTAVDPSSRSGLWGTRVETGYFLLADQRTYGEDSRRWGEIPPALCKGWAFGVLLPAAAPDGTSRGVFSRIE
jgi:signal peptidase I